MIASPPLRLMGSDGYNARSSMHSLVANMETVGLSVVNYEWAPIDKQR